MSNKTDRNPWLSIIIPIYNAEKYLAKCISSILMQSFSDFELILVDDGSTDGSGSICKEYAQKDKRIKYYLKENGGSIQARVFGIEQSIGDYFTFCDADDYYASKQALEIMHNEIIKNTCDLLQFSYIKKFNHLFKKEKLGSGTLANAETFYNNEYPKLLCSHWKEGSLTTTAWNKVYKKELKNNLPSYDSFKRVFWGEDLILNLYLLEHCRSASFIPDYLYIYRQFSGGTNKFSDHTMHDLDKIKEYQLQYIDRYQGNRKDDIINICFNEITGWFFSYIQQGLNEIGEKRIKELIIESLELPSFRIARKHYLNHPQIDNELITLLKHADADEYIRQAKQKNQKKSVKSKIVSLLKQIYKSI